MTNYLVVVLCQRGKCREIEVEAVSPHAAERQALRELKEEEGCTVQTIEVYDLGTTGREERNARRKCKCP